MVSHKNEFSRFATSYMSSNHLQRQIAKHLISLSENTFNNILDLGCGGGEIYKNIPYDFDKLVAIDSSLAMCEAHPKADNIDIIHNDFDDSGLFDLLGKQYDIDIVLSSSALHWSSDIYNLVDNISQISNNLLISAFTNNTFKQLHNQLNISSPIYSSDVITKAIESKFRIFSTESKTYSMEFASTKELLFFIKNTGISGGRRLSSVSDVLELIKKDIIRTLEFEVIYINACL